MIPDLEITPEDIAEAALLPFRMSKNVVLEVRRSRGPPRGFEQCPRAYLPCPGAWDRCEAARATECMSERPAACVAGGSWLVRSQWLSSWLLCAPQEIIVHTAATPKKPKK